MADRRDLGTDSVPRLVLAVAMPNSRERVDDGIPDHRSLVEGAQGLAPERVQHAGFAQLIDHATALRTSPLPE